MKKNYKYGYYRGVKTTNERRAWYNEDCKGLVRGRRNPRNLPNAYDDYPISYERSWKRKRKTQYRCGPKRKKFEAYFQFSQDYYAYRNFTDYLDKHDIYYRESRVDGGWYKELIWVRGHRDYDWKTRKYSDYIHGRWQWVLRREMYHKVEYWYHTNLEI